MITFQKMEEKRILYEEAQHMVLILRNLQQESMLESRSAEDSLKELCVNQEGYYYYQNTKATPLVAFPKVVKNNVGFRAFSFHKTGEPAGGKNLVLSTKDGQYVAAIYIAVQTGRIRLEMTEQT